MEAEKLCPKDLTIWIGVLVVEGNVDGGREGACAISQCPWRPPQAHLPGSKPQYGLGEEGGAFWPSRINAIVTSAFLERSHHKSTQRLAGTKRPRSLLRGASKPGSDARAMT